MSPKQIAANRRNARKSTGPKTSEGRAVSKMNAMKHGVLAQTVVVRSRNLKESPHDFKKLCREFHASLAPDGPLEEMLVDQIVQAAWRLRRARMAEAGEIALNVDEGQWKRSRTPHPQLQWMEWEVFGDPIPKMEESAFGNRLLENLLGEARKAVEQDGELKETVIQRLMQTFGGKANSLTRGLEELRLKSSQNPDGVDAAQAREENKKQALAFLDQKIRLAGWQQTKCDQREEYEEAARQRAAVLPSEAILGKILRYEAALERQLYRAVNQLERLQRRRQGENVPAPLTVDISART